MIPFLPLLLGLGLGGLIIASSARANATGPGGAGSKSDADTLAAIPNGYPATLDANLPPSSAATIADSQLQTKTPEWWEQGAVSYWKSGYPLTAQWCKAKGADLRRGINPFAGLTPQQIEQIKQGQPPAAPPTGQMQTPPGGWPTMPPVPPGVIPAGYNVPPPAVPPGIPPVPPGVIPAGYNVPPPAVPPGIPPIPPPPAGQAGAPPGWPATVPWPGYWPPGLPFPAPPAGGPPAVPPPPQTQPPGGKPPPGWNTPPPIPPQGQPPAIPPQGQPPAIPPQGGPPPGWPPTYPWPPPPGWTPPGWGTPPGQTPPPGGTKPAPSAYGLPVGGWIGPDQRTHYVLQSGDYGVKIAKKWGKADADVPALVKENPQISNWSKQLPGTDLFIPGYWWTAPPGAVETTRPGPPATGKVAQETAAQKKAKKDAAAADAKPGAKKKSTATRARPAVAARR